MNRMNGRVTGNPSDLGVDFEPSCLVRTPSGNVYIPSGNLSKFHFISKSKIVFKIKIFLILKKVYTIFMLNAPNHS